MGSQLAQKKSTPGPLPRDENSENALESVSDNFEDFPTSDTRKANIREHSRSSATANEVKEPATSFVSSRERIDVEIPSTSENRTELVQGTENETKESDLSVLDVTNQCRDLSVRNAGDKSPGNGFTLFDIVSRCLSWKNFPNYDVLSRNIEKKVKSFIPSSSKHGKLTRRKRVSSLSYPASHRPRQPFMNQPQNENNAVPARLPHPPRYYTNQVSQGDHQPQQLRERSRRASNSETGDDSNGRAQELEAQRRNRDRREQIQYNPYGYFQPGQLMMMPDTAMSVSVWAPYPDNIPNNVPACLAHLVASDALFIIQQMDVVELFLNVNEPNFYLIQNRQGQCLYYVYETSALFVEACCKTQRGFQLHVMDMYHNEIIYMNKPCGCNDYFCCYPVMEVYSPPLVPVGAITQVFNMKRSEFSILDADENKIFKIYGPCMTCACCGEAEFTIHALDWEETEVGIIRRQFGGMIRTYFTNTDYYGISFPIDLDVRIKAVFLGALFLIVSDKEKTLFCVFNNCVKIKLDISEGNNFFKLKYFGTHSIATNQFPIQKGGEKYVNKFVGNDETLKMLAHSNSANVISFLQLIGKLKSLKRTGWVLRNVEDPETVSGHMYRMGVMTFLIPESSGVDKTRFVLLNGENWAFKVERSYPRLSIIPLFTCCFLPQPKHTCMKLSLVHDLAECIVGDLTPFCGVDPVEKHRQEDLAMKELTQMVGESGTEIYTLYKEYEAQVTNESKFVKDLDRLDMVLQAFEYEKSDGNPGKLEEFFVSTFNKFHFPWTIDIVKEIYKQRNLFVQQQQQKA